jgi:Copper transport outer membrane protein, MctB
LINFRYHIVSLMAVFLALSVGIVLGVTLRGPVDEGLVQQAAQDRKQVQDLRTELDRRDSLDQYRDAYALRAGKILTGGILSNQRIVLIIMPDAPTDVANSLATAVTQSGGLITHTVKIDNSAFDPTKAGQVNKAIAPFIGQLQLLDTMSNATKFGLTLGRALLSREVPERDPVALAISDSLTSAGLVTIDGKSTALGNLAIVVTAQASDPRPTPESLTAHVDMDVALKAHAGVVVAGPNSDNIEGTDVLAARTDSASVDVLSTVDVADLTSGVTTVILAGKEQVLGRQGHYGALSKADAPVPQLPIR